MTLLLLVSGLIAGAVTTVAGAGGGLLLLLALSLAWDPLTALAVTAPALLLGNVHRAVLFRARIDRQLGWAFAVGAAPGAVAGGLCAVSVPAALVQAAMVFVTALAVLKALGKLEWSPSTRQMTPAGAVIGFLTGAAGGAGTLAGPLFLSAGLSGEAYIATTAMVASVMHSARIAAYGASGLFTREILESAGIVAIAIVVGNLVGRWLRAWTEKAPVRLLETATLVACVVLGLAGIGH